jgi:electron transfer flavoprotein beta subunit
MMDIVVCVKQVPLTAEAEVRIDDTGRDIKKERLAFDVNEADNYAVEEALLLTEKFGGTITLVTLGPESADKMLRSLLAKGAHQAVRLTDQRFAGSDAYATAKALSRALKTMKADLVLAGCYASDDGYSQVGATLAELLELPHATMVTGLEILNGQAKIERELEGGTHELLEIELPAVLTIQTGINEPRYASILGLRKAMKKPIQVLSLSDLDLTESEVGSAGSRTVLERLFAPPKGKGAQILEGAPEEISAKLAEIFRERGVV